MRLLSWNIGHGGGSRISEICRHIEFAEPDLLTLTEFQSRNASALRAQLEGLGYPYIATSAPDGNRNGVLVASKWQLDQAVDDYAPETDRERWLALRLDELDLDLLAVHIPGAPDNKFEDGYGISGAKRKEIFWESVIGYAAGHRDHAAIIVGDLNTGLRIDAEGAMFKKSHFMMTLIDTGFVDTFRHLYPQARQYTWYSKRKDKLSGQSKDLNGFRLDYIFVSPKLKSSILEAAILQEPRRAGASDHAVVLTDFNLQPFIEKQVHDVEDLHDECDGVAIPADKHLAKQTVQKPRAQVVNASGGRTLVRFDLAPGGPDPRCWTR